MLLPGLMHSLQYPLKQIWVTAGNRKILFMIKKHIRAFFAAGIKHVR
jgi:hypothetical protein